MGTNSKILETVIVHSPQYEGWVFSAAHPTQGRRFTKAFSLLSEQLAEKAIELTVLEPRLATVEELSRVHSRKYISEVLEDFECREWDGKREDLAHLAQLFAGGTLVALEALVTQRARTAIHFPGAKHHAQKDHSSGFCVFADFALAADIATKDHGLKVAIYDFDGHHGDGTENLTLDNPNILTLSIHEYGIFPGTGAEPFPEKNALNIPLSSNGMWPSLGKGDEALSFGVELFIEECRKFSPDLIFIAAGADGHCDDPLTSLQYSEEAMVNQAGVLRKAFPDIPMLVGGAGGYQPDTVTPRVWANFAALTCK